MTTSKIVKSSTLFGCLLILGLALALAKPSSAATTEILHDFLAFGAFPVGNVIEASDGNLYGTTSSGGASDGGTVFKIAKNGSGFTLIKSFGCGTTDGCIPIAGLIEGSDGNLYGTTDSGGASNQGTVFRIAKDGSRFSLLKSFGCSTTDGCFPDAGLIEGSDGNLYGTTWGGGLYGAGTVYRVLIDTTVPDTVIDSGSANPTNSTSAAFTFHSTESGSSFQCQLDGGGFSACASPKTYNGLADGSHTFQVRATDAAGNTDATPASYTWTIDTTAPDTVIDSGPANPTNSASASFTFHSTESGGSLQCQLDGGGFSDCASPKSYSGLAAGSHTFNVKATDAPGNTDATPASYTWTIDTTAPDTVIDSGPASSTNLTSAAFTFHSTEGGSSFQCSLDGAAFTGCSSPQNYSSLAAGSHTFSVKATDAPGNTDATPASYSWTIDTTAPNTVIDSGPANPTESTNASFVFRSTETGSSFQCQLDGAGYSPCNSPKAYSGLLPGSHTFEVRATDRAGNTDATPASHTWTILPNTLILSGPAPDSGGVTNNSSATFSFTSTAVGSTFTCSLDGAVFTTCSSPQTYLKLKAGLHNFQVIANNSFGNDLTAASFSWTIDTKAPKTTITSGPPKLTNTTSATFFFTSTEVGSTFACSLDGSAFAPCTSPQVYNGLASGKHAFQVRATDPAGNTDESAAKFSWKIQ